MSDMALFFLVVAIIGIVLAGLTLLQNSITICRHPGL
jgi:hypothetical protein